MPANDTNDMQLPAGATCRDCVGFFRCTKIISRRGHETECDWSPSAFRPAQTTPATTCRACGQRPATLCDQCSANLSYTTYLAYEEKAAADRADLAAALADLVDIVGRCTAAPDPAADVAGSLPIDLAAPLAAALARGAQVLAGA